MMRGMARIYVTGHRNPDTDSIASAVGYAELKGRLDPRNEYVPVRLGELNAQTRWVLERSGGREPQLLRTSCCARATSCASASRAPPTATPCARSA